MAGVISSNPTRDVISSGTPEKPKGAKPVATEELGDLLEKVQMSDFCIEKDLVDPIARKLLAGEIEDGGVIAVSAGNDGLVIGKAAVH